MCPVGLLIPSERPVLIIWSLFTGDVTREIADQRNPQFQFLPRMLW
jgi:hypothetical protein